MNMVYSGQLSNFMTKQITFDTKLGYRFSQKSVHGVSTIRFNR